LSGSTQPAGRRRTFGEGTGAARGTPRRSAKGPGARTYFGAGKTPVADQPPGPGDRSLADAGCSAEDQAQRRARAEDQGDHGEWAPGDERDSGRPAGLP